MSDYEIEKEVNNACTSVDIEGYTIDEQWHSLVQIALEKGNYL